MNRSSFLIIEEKALAILKDIKKKKKLNTCPTIQKCTCTNLLTEALLVTAKYWEQLRYPYTGEWLNELCHIHTIMYYAAMTKNDNEFYELMLSDFQSLLLKEYLYQAILHARKKGI